MMTTADLPADMQFNPNDERARAVRDSGLTLAVPCRHAQPCARCVAEAAQRLVDAAKSGA